MTQIKSQWPRSWDKGPSQDSFPSQWLSLSFGQVIDRLGLHLALRESPSLRDGGEKAGGGLGELAHAWGSLSLRKQGREELSGSTLRGPFSTSGSAAVESMAVGRARV